jgi:tRNA nucleotidyltransferase/poly(A) polymerase
MNRFLDFSSVLSTTSSKEVKFMQLQATIQKTLLRLQENGEAYIIGGFLRDQLCNKVANDIDIATTLTIPQIRDIFPRIQTTDKGESFGVCRLSIQNLQFEISSHPHKTIQQICSTRDFRINTMYHDGNTCIDLYGAKADIENKIIQSMESPDVHFKIMPQAYIRAIRLAAELGFHLESNLTQFLKDNQHYFHGINLNRIQEEGYRILLSNHPLQAFIYLIESGLIQTDHLIKATAISPHFLSSQLVPLRCAYLALLTDKDIVLEFVELFKLGKHIVEKTEYLHRLFLEKKFSGNPKVRNELITLARWFYFQQPEEFQHFALNL